MTFQEAWKEGIAMRSKILLRDARGKILYKSNRPIFPEDKQTMPPELSFNDFISDRWEVGRAE